MVQKEVFKDTKTLYDKTKEIKTSDKDFKDLTTGIMNIIIKEIIRYQKQFGHRYGEVLIASDYKKSNYWRKTIYPRYKESRDINKKNDFEKEINKNTRDDKAKLSELLRLCGFIVLDDIQHKETNETVEADDIIGVLTRVPGNHLICSSDGDFDQLLINPNIRRYNLLESKLVKKTNKEIQDKNYFNLIIGQSKDDIPNVKFQTELSDEFIKWMKTKHNIEITKDMIHIIEEKYSNYMKEYQKEMDKEDEQLISSGKRKKRRKLTAYKKPNFGEVAYNKMIESQGIDNFLQENTLYQRNYDLNKQLYLLENIPSRIVEIIGRSYLEAQRNKSSNKYEVEKLFYLYGIDIMLIHEFF